MKIFRPRNKIIIFILLAAFLLYSFLIEPFRLKIEQLSYEYTPNGQKITVVQFSDLHLRSCYDLTELAKIIEAINAQNPDIVVFTGDLLDKAESYNNLEEIGPYLAKINAKYGKFAVWGNHDYGGGAEKYYERILTDGGFRILCNEKLSLNIDDKHTLELIGLDEMIFGKPDYALLSTPPSVPTILLSHEPDTVLNISTANLPFLTLSGHSHGGQVRLPLIGSPIRNIYAKKYFYKDYTLTPEHFLYVNTGLGTTALPLRFGVAPSISVFSLAI